MNNHEPASKTDLLEQATYLIEKAEEVQQAAEAGLDTHTAALDAFRSNEDSPRNVSAEDVPGLEESQRLDPIPEATLEIEKTIEAAKDVLGSPLGNTPAIRNAVADILDEASEQLKEAASTVNDTTSSNISV